MAGKESELTRRRREFSERLNLLLDERSWFPDGKGRQTKLAEKYGVTQNGARRWLKGKGIPPVDVLERMAKDFGCRLPWLAFGLGPMLEDQAENEALMQRIVMAVDRAGVELTKTRQARLISQLYAALTT